MRRAPFLSLAVALLASTASAEMMTFDQALERAESHSVDLQAAKARLHQAREASSKVWASYLPQITVSGSYIRNSEEARIALPTGYYVRDLGAPQGPPFDSSRPPDIDNPPGTATNLTLVPSGIVEAVIQQRNQLGAQAQLTQALIVPALWPAIHNAYLAEDVAELSVENARRELLFGVAQLYFGAAALKQAVAVQQRLLQGNLAHERDARVRYESGATPKVALLRAELDRTRSEQDLKRAQNSYLGAKLSLATLLDRAPDFEVEIPEEPGLEVAADDLQGSAQERPDVLVARRSLEMSEGQRASSWLKLAPNLGFLAQYRVSNTAGFTGVPNVWALGLNASWTIFDGGLREAEIRESSAKVAEARAGLRSAELKAREEVARGLLDLDSARANRAKAQEQLALARESRKLTETSYAAGAATYLEVADANNALSNAEVGLITESLNASLATLRVLKAAGQFRARAGPTRR